MRTLRKLRSGLGMLRSLAPKEQKWVTTRLALSPDDLATAANLLRQLPAGASSALHPVVFLSHSHRDKAFVRALAKKLQPYRIRVWLDEAELNIGDSLLQKLSEVIDDVDLVVAVISAHSAKSSWVREELHLAMSDQIEGRRVKVLPIVKDSTPLPRFLRGRLYADFTTPYRRKSNLETLVRSIYAQAAAA
jgi:hypothetical protein